jgi:hypothetical protein
MGLDMNRFNYILLRLCLTLFVHLEALGVASTVNDSNSFVLCYYFVSDEK